MGAHGLTHHNRDFLIIQWPLFHCNHFQNKQHLKSIPDTPQILAFAHWRGTEQLYKVMSFGSSEKSHLKFISIIMSLVNNFVRKIYLHASHLCFHVVSELPINKGLCGDKSNNPKGRNLSCLCQSCRSSARPQPGLELTCPHLQHPEPQQEATEWENRA